MAHLSIEHMLMALDEINQSHPTIRCIGVTQKQKRQCLIRVQFDDNTAKTLQEKMALAYFAEGPSASRIRKSVIEALLERCCCRHHKTKFHADTLLGGEIRRRWQDQLTFPAPEDFVVEDKAHVSSSGVDRGHSIPLAESSPSAQAAPRYSLRSTQQVVHSAAGGADDVPRVEFLPITKVPQTLVQKLLLGPAGKRLRIMRHLYLFCRTSNPGMFKVGVTKNIANRFKKWKQTCGYQPILKHHLENVPCAEFVEGLIHCELLLYWRKEIRCKHNPKCATQHMEWFQIDHATASKAMDNWVEWITVAEPYDESYQLKPEWRAIIESMDESGIPVTSQGLLDAMESLQVNVAAPSDDNITATTATTTTVQSSIEGTPQTPVVTKAPSRIVLDVAGAANDLSTVAGIILSLTPAQMSQLRDLLDQGIRRRSPVPLPPTTPLIPVA